MGNVREAEIHRGKIITDVKGCYQGSDEVTIIFEDGGYIELSSSEDSSNDVRVWLEDFSSTAFRDGIEGAKFDNIIEKNGNSDSLTYTFYTITTSKGYLDLRWAGNSNGCYSEHCDIIVN